MPPAQRQPVQGPGRPRGSGHNRIRGDAWPERSDRNTGAHLKSQVANGENWDTMVGVDARAATDTLCAMLHVDAGQEGALQFPGGADTPVTVGEQVVTPASLVTVLLSGSPNSQAQAGQRQKTEHRKRAAA